MTTQNETQKMPELSTQDIANQAIITEIAAMCHWANRSYCHMQGDDSQPKWADAPQWQKDSAIQGVEMLLRNPFAGPEDSHESWYAQKLQEGWKYGPVKNPDTKEHPCMVSYAELPYEQQMKDSIFLGVARSMLKKAMAEGKLLLPRMTSNGQRRMGVNFNPGRQSSITRIKEAAAELFDLIEMEGEHHSIMVRNREHAKRLEGLSPEERIQVNSGALPLATPPEYSDCLRALATALTHLQTAMMFAVEAVTR